METNRIYGLAEPIAMMGSVPGYDIDAALKRVEAIGPTAFREWMHIPDVLKNPNEVNEKTYPNYTKVLNKLIELDVEITGMSHMWFLTGESFESNNNSMYSRDLNEGSLYMQTLEMLEQSWFTMAKSFPQVTQWEVGNEWNLDQFLHPIGWKTGEPGFSEDEKMDIAVDMQYYAAKGIHRGNPEAKVVMFAPAVTQVNLGGHNVAIFCPPSYAIPYTVNNVYSRIKSGQFWSDNSDDYFDLVAIHPYLLTQIMPMAASETYPAERRYFRKEDIDAAWRMPIDMVYTIMSMNGDGHKKLLLTEMGFSDWDIPGLEEEQAQMQIRLFEMVKTMPYVKTIHSFRLYAPKLNEVSEGFLPMGEVTFGMFRRDENDVYRPRKKAYILQEIYGGKGELI